MTAFFGTFLAAAVLYGAYAIPTLSLSVRTMAAMEQCQQDFVQALNTKTRIGRISDVSAACAATDSVVLVSKALRN